MKLKKFAAFMAAAGGTALAAAVSKAKLDAHRMHTIDMSAVSGRNDTRDFVEKPLDVSIDYKELSDDVISALVGSFEQKMPYYDGHSRRVAKIARDIGKKMKLTDLDGLYYTAMLHDIGKIYMSRELLNKSKLSMTEDEIKEWHNHPRAGAALVKKISRISEYSSAVKYHHERFDGSGYPDGLKGSEIPIMARIIEAADAYEAMSSERPGREAYPREYIVAELTKCSGTQFDPAVVKALMSVIADKHM